MITQHKIYRLGPALRNKASNGGPNTEEGKAISSQNALKHGVLSNTLAELDKVDANKLFESLCDEFNAVSCHQKMIVEQLVLCYIKLSRCSRIEADMLKESLNTTKVPFKILEKNGDVVDDEMRALINEQSLKKMELLLIRYEPLLNKRMIQLIETLKKFQTVK
jgi:hypothetical protein